MILDQTEPCRVWFRCLRQEVSIVNSVFEAVLPENGRFGGVEHGKVSGHTAVLGEDDEGDLDENCSVNN